MRRLIYIILIFICISCTTTKYIEVPIETIRTEYINQVYKDSIFVHDSIDRYVSGDTVYQYKYKYIYQHITKTDTIVKVDSIEVPVKVTEIQEVNKIKWYQNILMQIGGISLLLIVFKIGRVIKQ